MSGFSVRQSGRAKRLSIKVYPRGRVEVVVPKRTRADEVQAFVDSHRDWIRSAREKFAAEHTPEPFALPASISLAAIGRHYQVRYRQESRATSVRFRVDQGVLTLSGHVADEKLCVAALKRWLLKTAKSEYSARLRTLAQLTGNDYKRMAVRGQRTCWGSHSSNGTISLNYCLLFLDPDHLRYVMIHELCHAQHMNHSKRFWRLVARHEPNYRQLDKDLNTCWKRIPTWVGIY